MMGNIFAKFKDDVPTALKYYGQALKANPGDHIAMNHIGTQLMRQGKIAEGKEYLRQALQINGEYPNTHFALGMIALAEGDLQAALEFEGGRLVESVADKDIPTAARMEFAENYGREKHVIRYKPDHPAVEHLVMHELAHLDFVIQARKTDDNQLFVATSEHRDRFVKRIGPTLGKLRQMGVSEQNIAGYCKALFEGFNRQVFNAPIDLFIEEFLYRQFPEIRAWQFLSLYNIIREGIQAVTDKKAAEVSPKEILSKSRIYNMVGAIQFKALYGLDLTGGFQATPGELKQAEAFYEEYLEYKDDRKPTPSSSW
jgi:tetratricopeptide (TPR) repeat protein